MVHNDAMSGGSSPGSSPGRRHCVVVLIKTLYSHIASLYPGVEMGTGEFTTGGKPWGGLASHPGGIRNARSRFILQKISSGLMGCLARMQTLPHNDVTLWVFGEVLNK